jgi:hypothetical protein
LQRCLILMNTKCTLIYKMTHKFIIIIVIAIVYIGCEKKSSETISPEKFASIYVDVRLSGAWETNIDSLLITTNREKTDSILARHGVTIEKIKSTIDTYNKDVSKWKEFYDVVIRKLTELNKKK